MGVLQSIQEITVANVTVTANANIGGIPTTTVTTQGDHNLKVGDSVTGAGGFICGFLASIRAIVAAVSSSRSSIIL